MSEQVNLNATNREVEGKSSSRQLRRSGSVPAVIYGGEKDPIRISILEKDIAKAAEIPVILLENGYTEKNTTEIYHNHLIKDFIGIEKIISKYL